MPEFIPILIASWAYEMNADGLRLSLPVGEDRLLHLTYKLLPPDKKSRLPSATPLCRKML